ncbi:NAD(P)-dependent dehydrogenase, short-chain alcohol dehydrogenase family [Paraburkholderia steynii]|uniref:NAD(P)-dependent dehydrogenase, short-chain alcohol dehydrogenase family n=1 Tax=Paraburkholderia steynii TaxID=1245441 RepID=A0A7Z7BLQ6_9BURK|nr:SDR family oxidoreductase [Paraburkholderia steynii]SDJ53571.1 NAD(P)-dependent dehydrogenase, short-chain alcohol dehydrogenase family [Paraburkholderia steynii]
MNTYRDQVVIITGGTSGIGEHIVRRMAAEGAKVVTNSRSVDGCRIEEELRAQALDVVWTQADVSRPNECKALAELAIERYGRIDVLVNNAGNKPETLDRSVASLNDSDLQDALSTHLNGPFNLCTAVWPYMAEQKYGRILNFSSGHIFGSMKDHGIIPFAIAKAGIMGLTRSLSFPGRQCGIRINAIFPAALDTQWNRVGWNRISESAERHLAGICSKRSLWPFIKWICSRDATCNGEFFSVCNDNMTRIFIGDTVNVSCNGFDAVGPCVEELSNAEDFYIPRSIGHFFGEHLGAVKSEQVASLIAELSRRDAE